MRQAAKTILSSSIGTMKEISGQLLPWILCHLMKILFWQFMTFTFAYGKSVLILLFLPQWSLKDLIILQDVGVPHVLVYYSSVNQMEPLIFGTLWTNPINGPCSTLLVLSAFHQWNSMSPISIFLQSVVNKEPFTYLNFPSLLLEKLVMKIKQWTNSGIVRFKASATFRKNYKRDSKSLSTLELNNSNNKGSGFRNKRKNKKEHNRKKSLIKNTNNSLKHF